MTSGAAPAPMTSLVRDTSIAVVTVRAPLGRAANQSHGVRRLGVSWRRVVAAFSQSPRVPHRNASVPSPVTRRFGGLAARLGDGHAAHARDAGPLHELSDDGHGDAEFFGDQHARPALVVVAGP